MTQHNLLAVYGDRDNAERARNHLISMGIPSNDIRLSKPYEGERTKPEPSFWGWLFGEVPEQERAQYSDEICRNNRVVLSVRADDTVYQRATDVMEEFEPVEVSEYDGETDVRRGTEIGAGSEAAEARAAGARAEAARARTGTAGTAGAESEQVIPVVKEELAAGKRVTEQRHRIRSYVIERPAQASVTLHDERVDIERRPATGAGEIPREGEREVEVIEHHEEPVAEKRGQVAEEVVVRKTGSDRTETVHGTVGETKVEVEQPTTPRTKPATKARP